MILVILFDPMAISTTTDYRHYNYEMTICGHSGKGNEKNFGKKLFTTDPLGALFTSSRRGTL